MSAFEDESTEWLNYRYALPCTLSHMSSAGYYNASATVMETFGHSLENLPFFRMPRPGNWEAYSLSTFFVPFGNEAGVINMAQVRT